MSADLYYKLIKDNDEELDELIEEVVVPETWFFRNITPFEVLRENASKIYSKRRQLCSQNEIEPRQQLKILSAPCSSGEEPYSIAMALSEAGLKDDDFLIDAIDVSRRALKKARRAIYGKHSFREPGMNIQEKYFEKVKAGFRLLPIIRSRVSFQQKNIITDSISPSEEFYDVIFCRNLLIYFDRETQRKILNKLSKMLKSGGLLFVGHAETGPIDKRIFTKVCVTKSFSFRKNEPGNPEESTLSAESQPMNKLKDIYDQLVEVTRKDIELSKKINNPKYVKEENPTNKKPVNDIFLQVDELIDSGNLLNASQLCEELLKQQPENSDAYYYLGLMSSIQGSVGGAIALLKKAIYLSPNHHKALALFAALAEGRGDNDVAKSLRRREHKARERNL